MFPRICFATIGIIIFTIFTTQTYSNDKYSTIDNIPLRQCKLQNVAALLILQSIKREAVISTNLIKTLDELRNLSLKARDSKKPIGEQLSITDLAKFSKAFQQVQTMKMANLVESRYQRDLRLIQKLTEIADNYYRWEKLPDENSKDILYAAILFSWRNEMESKDFTRNTSNKCTLDYSLYLIELEPAKKLSNIFPVIKAGVERVNQIYAKYNVKEKTFTILNEEDKKEVSSIREAIIVPARNEDFYLTDLENIRHFAKISELIYQSYMKHILYSGGNIEIVISTIENLIKSGEVNQEDEKMLRYWQLINEKFPSDEIKKSLPSNP